MGGQASREVHVEGTASPGYESVRAMFEENFRTGRETHAQLCVYVGGEKVVDLWGSDDKVKQMKFGADTLTNIYSSTKSLTAIAMAMLVDKGLLNYDNKITDYWPEFGQKNKQNTTVADLMRHEAGLGAFNHTFKTSDFLPENIKKNCVGSIIEQEEQWFKEGKVREYHALTRGWIANEIFRRVDPHGRTIGEVLRSEVSEPLGARAYIGLKKEEIHESIDVESMKISFVLGQSLHPKSLGRKIDKNFIELCKSVKQFSKMKDETRQGLPPIIEGITNNIVASLPAVTNDPVIKQGESSSVNGQCCARGLALIGAAMANKGKLNGVEILSEAGWLTMHANPIVRPTFGDGTTNFTQGGVDLIQSQDVDPNDPYRHIKGPEGFYGWMGFGGSVFQWHPDYQIGFAYVPVLLSWYDLENLKGKHLQEEVVKCYKNLNVLK